MMPEKCLSIGRFLKRKIVIMGVALLIPLSVNAETYFSYLNLLMGQVKVNGSTSTKGGFAVLLGYEYNRYLILEGQLGLLGNFEYSALFFKPKIYINDKKTGFMYVMLGGASMRIEEGTRSDSGSAYGIGYASCTKSRTCLNYELKKLDGDIAEASIAGISLSFGF